MERDPEKEKRKQIIIIHKLASRLPWIAVAVSLVAFALIFLQAYLSKFSNVQA